MTSPWQRLDDLLSRYDGSVRFDGGSECAWSGELRLTLTDPEGAPSRSIAFYSVGAAEPAEVAVALLADFDAWLSESPIKPMPVPRWMS